MNRETLMSVYLNTVLFPCLRALNDRYFAYLCTFFKIFEVLA